MSTPPEKLEQSIGHGCQNDHGVLADVVLVQLATGETDMLCQPCLATMMAVVLAQVVQNSPELSAIAERSIAEEATAAAAAALSAD
jgi:hypothetical protein